MLPSRINLVTLGVSDLEISRQFYQALGWVPSPASNENVTFFLSQGTVLGLYGREALAEDAQVSAEGDGFRCVTLALNCDSPEQVDQYFQHAVTCGATPKKQPEKVFWGGYSGYFADPDGHLWEVAHNPFMPLDEQGHMQLPNAD